MIDIRNGELKDLWPDETSPEFLSISYAIKLQIVKIIVLAATVGIQYDIDGLDEEVVDFLALELRTQYYDQSLPIETKRELVKKTLKWHSKAGTPSAVKELIAAIFGSGELVEWFNMPDGAPYTFEIKTDATITPTIVDNLTRMIRRVKNVRSHLTSVTAHHHVDKPIYYGAAAANLRHYILNEMPHLKATETGTKYIGATYSYGRRYTFSDTRDFTGESSGTKYIGATYSHNSHYIISDARDYTGESSGIAPAVGVIRANRHYIIKED